MNVVKSAGEAPHTLGPETSVLRSKAWIDWALLGCLACGAFLRIWQFAFNRSLWLDEAYLATSFIDRDTWALLTEPLANGQAAPLGFLLAAKMAFIALGGADWTLRVVPLTAGLLTLLFGWKVSLLAFRQPWARVLFVGLVAFSPVLIYYASEFKQYGGDVLWSLMIVWAALAFRVDDLRRSCGRLVVVGVVGVWFSHASVFMLASAGLVLGFECVLARRWRVTTALAVVGLLWFMSFSVHYGISLRGVAANPALTQFWEMAYAPLPPFEAGEAAWYGQSGLGLAYLAFRHVGVAVHVALPEWTEPVTVALAVAVFGGWVLLWRGNRRLWAMIALPILITLLASAWHLYPFRSRLILFLMPLLWLAMAALIEHGLGPSAGGGRLVHGWQAKAEGFIGPAVVIMLLAFVSRPDWAHWRSPYNAADIKGAMAQLQKRRAAGDHVMINSWSEKAFAFYKQAYELGDMKAFIYPMTPNVHHDGYATVRRLCRAGERGRTWVLLSHRFNDRQAILGVLQQIAPISEQWEGNGAGVYLMDFSNTAYCLRYQTPRPI